MVNEPRKLAQLERQLMVQLHYSLHKVASGINKYMDKTYYILYQITNNLNGKIYVGVHKTRNINDGYMGSGKVINAAIAKHGIENFTRVILEQFENSTAMYAREKEVVTDEFLSREDTYNLRRGGHGGFDYINKSGKRESGHTWNEDDRRKATKARKAISSEQWSNMNSARFSTVDLETRRKWNAAGRAAMASKAAMEKRKSTFERMGHGKGEKNSQFGKIWISNGVEVQKICRHSPIPDGWHRGRK